MCRAKLTLLPLPVTATFPNRWIQPHLPLKLVHSHEKIRDTAL